MAGNENFTGLQGELSQALDALSESLDQAAAATAAIRAALPRLAATRSVLDEIEALLRGGREAPAAAAAPASEDELYTAPTLVAPATPSPKRPAPRAKLPAPPTAAPSSFPLPDAPTMIPQASAPAPSTSREYDEIVDEAPPSASPGRTGHGPLVSFRLEFESRGGPLDLRRVDEAVAQHPAVRDVALLDYDGRRATLKVWISSPATPADVQNALTAPGAHQLFAGSEVTVVALEDVA